MRYVLDERFVLRGWNKLPYALLDQHINRAIFVNRDEFKLLLQLNGKQDIDEILKDEAKKKIIDILESENAIHKAEPGETRDLYYQFYPAMYKRSVHWSITGRCNYHCKHCFQLAPDGVLGEPSLEQCLDLIRQFDECGIRDVSLTGGEPLIREDFFDIVDEIVCRGMRVTTIYSNGKLVTHDFLEKLKEHKIHPAFQISFDGVDWHDWMRGVEGAEQIALDAIKLLHDNGYGVSSSMCLCKENVGTIRETVKKLAEVGCRGLKLQCTSPEGAWEHEKEHHLTTEEAFQAYLDYLPLYKEDGCPLGLQMEGFFSYNSERDSYSIPAEKNVQEEKLDDLTPCEVITNSLYVAPHGAVVPCMSMGGKEVEKQFPNVFEMPLKDILTDSSYTDIITKSMRYMLDSQEECRNCPHRCACCGGCRAFAVAARPDNYFAPDPVSCIMHKNGWIEKLHQVADKLWTRETKIFDEDLRTEE